MDGLVAGAVLLVGVPEAVRSGTPESLLLDLGLVLPLVWRRRAPLAVFAVLAGVALLQWSLGVRLPADAALLVALYTVAAWRPRRWALLAAGVVEVGVLLAALRFTPARGLVPSLVFLTGLAAAAFFIGTTAQNRRAYLTALVDRAAWLERERDQQARLAATTERARIARELHDIVAHSLTVVVTLAEAAVLSADTDPPASRAAMTAVAGTGRAALGEMRRLLGVLRTDGTVDDRSPPPGLDGIDDLVAGARAASLPVRLTVSGGPRPLPSTLEATAYRVVQESLTNALKHAADPTMVQVRLGWRDDGLLVEVLDDGRPSTGSGTGGHGLAGMRERLALFGGSLSVGPVAAGGWAVTAVLPVPEDAP